MCHVGFVAGGQPYVIPTGYARHGDVLYLHGSPASRMLRTLEGGAPVCVTVTLLDGLVVARSAFHSSMNYRSVVILGTAGPRRSWPSPWTKPRRRSGPEARSTTRRTTSSRCGRGWFPSSSLRRSQSRTSASRRALDLRGTSRPIAGPAEAPIVFRVSNRGQTGLVSSTKVWHIIREATHFGQRVLRWDRGHPVSVSPDALLLPATQQSADTEVPRMSTRMARAMYGCPKR